MKLKIGVRLFAVLDLLLFGWVIYKSCVQQRIPFISSMVDGISAAKSFELHSITFAVISSLGSIALFSLLFSAVFLWRESLIGVWISLTQMPFRFLLVIQPTFYLPLKALNLEALGPEVFVLILLGLEFAKIVVLYIWWRRRTKKSKSL